MQNHVVIFPPTHKNIMRIIVFLHAHTNIMCVAIFLAFSYHKKNYNKSKNHKKKRKASSKIHKKHFKEG
jgi:hypothetical protein